MSEVNGSSPRAEYMLKDAPVENLRPLKVRVIGAGFSGILAAIRIPERLRNIDMVVYEKNEGLGGVWWLNRYPGLACDIPSHSYQYTFAPNPHWTNLYAPGLEIQRYLQGVAEKFGATRFIKTSHKLERAVWDAVDKKWKLTVLNVKTGERFDDDCNVLITARGQLNELSWPNVPGLDRFEGKIMHSGGWDESYDFTNKRIGVIGNGSSAIQIVPSLQKVEGATLKSFMRSRTWISSAFGDMAMVQLGLDPNVTDFPKEKREELANDPEGYLKMRKVIETGGNMIHDSTLRGTKMQRDFQEAFAQGMRARLAKKPELADVILPTFAPGCRRLTPGTGYLESLTEPNVEVITETIETVTETGIQLPGRAVPLDVLVCATGFKVSEPPPFEVVGCGGRSLVDRWAGLPESYLSLAVDGFPNYLMMFGPNSAIGFGSLTKILEAECDYIVKLVRKLQKEDYASVEPRPERVADFTAYVGAYFRDTVYTDHCKSWYKSKGGEGDWIVGLWPGSTLHALDALRSPRWEDFVFESADGSGNALRWLGNGWSTTQLDGDASWYINPDEIDWPAEGEPEKGARYLARPWSY